MKWPTQTIALTALLTLHAGPAPAQDVEILHALDARVCNKTGDTVWAAIGYHDGDQWFSEGWFRVYPHDCRTILPNITGPIFLLAVGGEEVGDGPVWLPDEGYPTRRFCINRAVEDDFVYTDDDCDDSDPDTYRQKFGRVVDEKGDGVALFNVRYH